MFFNYNFFNLRSIFLILAYLFSFVLVNSQVLSSEKINEIKSAVVYIKVKHNFPFAEEETTTYGSGFFISEYGHIVTNYHVIRSSLSIDGLNYPAPVSEIQIIKNSGTPDFKVFNASVLVIDKTNDIAILYIDDTTKVPYLELDFSNNLVETMPIWVFGYPFGSKFSVIQRGPAINISKGYITSLRRNDRNELAAIQIDAEVNFGNSGGPLINQEGKVIGIVNITSAFSPRVNLAVPIHYLAKLLEDINLTEPPQKTITFSVISEPSEAYLFIDNQLYSQTPLNKLEIKNGWHTLCLKKEGYQTYIREQIIKDKETIYIKLSPLKPKEIKTKKIKTSLFEIPYVKEDIFLDENFDNVERFNSWKQSRGGNEGRTWFIENGVLNQFESNEILHTISLGEESWKNYMVSAKVKIHNEQNDSRAGIIFRETEDGFYLFRIHRETNKAQLAYHTKNPFGWFIIDEKILDIDITDNWYKLIVYVYEDLITCFVDSILVFSVKTDYSLNGKVGLYSVESKASYDSLVVASITPVDELKFDFPTESNLLSFWFSDYFTSNSTYWYLYKGNEKLPSPWIYTDNGFILLSEDDKSRYCEFTKYQFADFSLDAVVILSEKLHKEGNFQVFFRKIDDKYFAINFSNKDNKIHLLSIEKPNVAKVLKSYPLPKSFFHNISYLNIDLIDNSIACYLNFSKLFEYKNKKLKPRFGSLGFIFNHLDAILYQVSVSSSKK